jgi:hypothetical protein
LTLIPGVKAGVALFSSPFVAEKAGMSEGPFFLNPRGVSNDGVLQSGKASHIPLLVSKPAEASALELRRMLKTDAALFS